MEFKHKKTVSALLLILLIFVVQHFHIQKQSKITAQNIIEPNPATTAAAKTPNVIQNKLSLKGRGEPSLKVEKQSNYIAVCEEPTEPEDVVLANDSERLLPLLKQNIDMESDISIVLISKGKDEKELLNSLKTLNDKYPESKLISYDLLSHCTSLEEPCDRSIIESGISLDYQNGAIWLLAALYEIKNNKFIAAINALEEAVNAPFYEEYWGEHITVLESALLKAGAGDDLPAKIASVKYASAVPLPNFGILAKFCSNINLNNEEIMLSCLSAGEKLAQGESTLLTHLIGLAIQRYSLEKLNMKDQLTQVLNESKMLVKVIDLSNKARTLTLQSRERTIDWLQVIKDSGEVSVVA